MIKKIYPLLPLFLKIWSRCKTHKILLTFLLILSVEAVWLNDAISDHNDVTFLLNEKKNQFDLTKNNLVLLEESTKNNQNNVLFVDFKRKKFDQVLPDNIVQKVLKNLSEKIKVRLNTIRIISDEILDQDLQIFVKKITVSVLAKNNMKFYQFVHMMKQKLPGLVIFKDITFQHNTNNPDLSHGQITFLWARKKMHHAKN